VFSPQNGTPIALPFPGLVPKEIFMTLKFVVLAVSASLMFSACARKNRTSEPAAANQPSQFEASLTEAKGILGKTETGKSVVKELDAQLASGAIAKISAVSDEELKKSGISEKSGIKAVSAGKYEIVVSDKLEKEELAQALAHELIHVQFAVEEDKYLTANKDVAEKLSQGAKLMKTVPSEDAQPVADANASLAALSHIFVEGKAYLLNLQLDKEGIAFTNDELKAKGLVNYLVDKHVPKHIILSSDVPAIEAALGKNSSLVEYQKGILASQVISEE
jgi:hypothetical protein